MHNETCWNLLKGLSVVICGFIKTFYLFIGKVQIQTPSIWNIEADLLSNERFNISMATSFVHPLRKWVSTSILFTGEGTSLSH